MCNCTTIPLLFHTVPTTAEKFISWGELFCYLWTEVLILCYQLLYYNHFHPTIILEFLAAHLMTNSLAIITISVGFMPCVNLFSIVFVCVWVLTYFFCFCLLQELLASQDGHCSMDLVYGSFFKCSVLLHIFWMWYTAMCCLPLKFSIQVGCWTT